MRPFKLLAKEEKTWFFLLCCYQPKINKLIFLIFYKLPSVGLATPSVLLITSRSANAPLDYFCQEIIVTTPPALRAGMDWSAARGRRSTSGRGLE
ncbi:hypothetical protein EGY12_15490 [Serratia sp. FDAARGOS_506]|nr:hypothetical protein EGY12_15490 [Serratia sp. FDAARGOS_506]